MSPFGGAPAGEDYITLKERIMVRETQKAGAQLRAPAGV